MIDIRQHQLLFKCFKGERWVRLTLHQPQLATCTWLTVVVDVVVLQVHTEALAYDVALPEQSILLQCVNSQPPQPLAVLCRRELKDVHLQRAVLLAAVAPLPPAPADNKEGKDGKEGKNGSGEVKELEEKKTGAVMKALWWRVRFADGKEETVPRDRLRLHRPCVLRAYGDFDQGFVKGILHRNAHGHLTSPHLTSFLALVTSPNDRY